MALLGQVLSAHVCRQVEDDRKYPMLHELQTSVEEHLEQEEGQFLHELLMRYFPSIHPGEQVVCKSKLASAH